MVYVWLILAFLSSSMGALFLLITRHLNEKMMSILYGSAAGTMMAACFFSLLIPALQSKNIFVIIAFLGGIFFIFTIDHLLPHESALTHEVEGFPVHLSSYVRLMLTMAMHNMVQGIALGISFSCEQESTVLMLGTGLVLGNLVEGAATALPLVTYFASFNQAFWRAEALSFLEIPFCLIGAYFSSQLQHVIHPLFGFGAAILLYTVIEEMIPDAWAQHNRALSTLALFGGICTMMLLYIYF